MSCTEIFQNLYLSCPQRFQSSKTKKEKKILKDFLNCLVLAGLTETPRVICLLCPVVLPLSPSCLVKGILESEPVLAPLVCVRVESDVSKAMS